MLSTAVIGVGRVKTPTLAIVCGRELEIRAFRPRTYFEVVAVACVAGSTFPMRHAPPERILKQEDAEASRRAPAASPVRLPSRWRRSGPKRPHRRHGRRRTGGARTVGVPGPPTHGVSRGKVAHGSTPSGDVRQSIAGNDGTRLNIPFGNKELAMRLGARYRTGGWFAPPGTRLEPFQETGWL